MSKTRQPGIGVEHTLPEPIQSLVPKPKDLTVVVGLRVRPGEVERERNARAALESLNRQDLARCRYQLVVVEQDDRPRLESTLGQLVDHWIFVRNPGPYNRGWAFNVGASHSGPATGALCLADADLLYPRDFLRTGLAGLDDGAKAVLPYSGIRYLTPASTEAVLREVSSTAPEKGGEGRLFRNSQGGCLFIDASAYSAIRGFDERFEGWGSEDREFLVRLTRHYPVRQLQATLVHLDHPRPDESGPDARRNRALFESVRHGEVPPGSTTWGRLDRYHGATNSGRVARDWEQWDSWPNEKMRRIVERERESTAGSRPLVARLLEQFGPQVLDVGCGSGAVLARLQAQKVPVSWTGIDITHKMLQVARTLFPGASLVHADAGELPFRDDSFPAVLVRHLLEHLPESLMRQTLAEALRVASRLVLIDFYLKPRNGSRETRRVGEGFLENHWNVSDIEEPIVRNGWQSILRLAGAGQSELWVLSSAGATEVADFLSTERDVHRSVQSLRLPLPPRRQRQPGLLSTERDVHRSGQSLRLPLPLRRQRQPGLLSAESRWNPMISIIMPTYQRSHVLPRAVKSVLNQTYLNWELLMVDNAGDAVIPFNDSRIRVLRHVEKASAAYARNRGIEYAKGDLVCFFDDDDVMYPEYLESFVAAFRDHPNASMVRCGMQVGSHRIDYSYATPECCIRREFATPTWDDRGPCQDQRYFKAIAARHAWSEKRGDIVVVRLPVCRACKDRSGGLRSGNH
jgi:glycosyltransferase involved in cell wall biosynthesis/SAM-dependent methyltransferase